MSINNGGISKNDRRGVGMIKGRKVYDLLTRTWSTGYWVIDEKGNYYPVWSERSNSGRKILQAYQKDD